MNRKIVTIVISIVIVACVAVMIFTVAHSKGDNAPSSNGDSEVKSAQATDDSVSFDDNEIEIEENPIEDIPDKVEIETLPPEAPIKTEKASTSKPAANEKSTDSADINYYGITVNQALEMLGTFYGTTYNVSVAKSEEEYQYFTVYDKKGGKYAKVKVNLINGDAEETIIKTKEVNNYNLIV